MTQDERTRKINEILVYCESPRSIAEIMERCGFKSRKSFYVTYMDYLLKSGKLQMTIPEKPSSKYQKYIAKNRKEEKK